MDLRRAAHGVRILHGAGALGEPRAFQEGTHAGRAGDLSGMAAGGVDLRVEGTRAAADGRSEEHTSELQSHSDLVCRLLLEKKKNEKTHHTLCYSGQA